MKPQAINPSKLDFYQIKHLARWMEANGIDPAKVLRRKIIFTGNRLIFHEIEWRQVRTGGKRAVEGAHGMFKSRRRVVRVRVPFQAMP